MSTDLTTQTPVEIDTVLYSLYVAQNEIGAKIATTIETLHHVADDHRTYGRGPGVWTMTDDEAITAATTVADAGGYQGQTAARYLSTLTEARETLAENHAEQQVLGAEFRRRGGWTRAFLVTNGDGHVHSSMDCSTCNRGQQATAFQWMVDYSGTTTAEIIDAAGWRCCTVCFKGAPLGPQEDHPTRMFSDADKTKAEAKAERDAKKAAALAKKIEKGLTVDGSEFVVSWLERNKHGWDWNPQTRTRESVVKDREETERFKTEQAAIQWVVQYTAWASYGGASERDAEKQPAFDAIIEAVAAKHGKTVDQVREEVAAKVAAKIKRDSK